MWVTATPQVVVSLFAGLLAAVCILALCVRLALCPRCPLWVRLALLLPLASVVFVYSEIAETSVLFRYAPLLELFSLLVLFGVASFCRTVGTRAVSWLAVLASVAVLADAISRLWSSFLTYKPQFAVERALNPLLRIASPEFAAGLASVVSAVVLPWAATVVPRACRVRAVPDSGLPELFD